MDEKIRLGRCMSAVKRAFAAIPNRWLSRWCLMSCAWLFIIYAAWQLLALCILPAQVEIWEGRHLGEAWLVAQGQPIYRDPVQYGAAGMYTPLYPLLLGQALRLTGPSLAAGRFLTLLCTVVCGCVLAWRMRREGWLPLRVIPLFGALFLSVAWQTAWHFAVIRVDMLCHMLWVLGLGALLLRGRAGALLSAILLSCAFYTKPTALMVLPGAFLFVLSTGWRRGLAWAVAMVFALVGGFFLFRELSGEWMFFYAFERMMVQAGRVPLSGAIEYAFSVHRAPLLLAGAAVAVCGAGNHWKHASYRLALLLLPFLAFGSCYTAAAPGAGPNSMLPIWLCLVVLAMHGTVGVLEACNWKPLAMGVITVLLLFGYDSRFPYHLAKFRGKFDADFVQIVADLRRAGGTMYAPTDNVITLLAGHECNDDIVLAREIGWHWDNAPAIARISNRVNSASIDWLVFKDPSDDIALLTPDVARRYHGAGRYGVWTLWHRQGSEP